MRAYIIEGDDKLIDLELSKRTDHYMLCTRHPNGRGTWIVIPCPSQPLFLKPPQDHFANFTIRTYNEERDGEALREVIGNRAATYCAPRK